MWDQFHCVQPILAFKFTLILWLVIKFLCRLFSFGTQNHPKIHWGSLVSKRNVVSFEWATSCRTGDNLLLQQANTLEKNVKVYFVFGWQQSSLDRIMSGCSCAGIQNSFLVSKIHVYSLLQKVLAPFHENRTSWIEYACVFTSRNPSKFIGI